MASCGSVGSLLPKVVALATGFVLSLSVAAKTTTWQGGASGDFATAANWTDGAPVSGDTVVFAGSDAVTITGSFDIGADGITLDNAAATVTCEVGFSGTGKFVKTGAGVLLVNVWTSFSGGTRVENGTLKISDKLMASATDRSQRFGTGEIELVRYSDSAPTLFCNGGWYETFLNNVKITGAITAGDGAIRCGNPNQYFNGKITADSDFLITAPGGYAGCYFRGDIEAPGHTVLVFSSVGTGVAPEFIEFLGKVNANVKKITTDSSYTWQGASNVKLSGVSTGRDNLLTVDWRRSIVLEASAQWAGDVLVDGAKTAAKGYSDCSLVLNGSDNLSPLATVTLANGGKLQIASGVRCSASKLVVDGSELPDGVYNSTNLPNAITGDGEIEIQKRKAWQGGAEGDVAVAANWSDNAVPVIGDRLTFTGSDAVKLTGKLELGEGTLTIENSCEVDVYAEFTGAMKIVKLGGGTLDIHARSWHTGGTQLRNGELKIDDNDFTGPWSVYHTCFGSGEIELVRFSDALPRLTHRAQKQLVNKIRITGAITASTGAISCGNINNMFTGSITADSDFYIRCAWGGVKFAGAVEAPGHTISCAVGCDASYFAGLHFENSVNANIKKVTAASTPDWQFKRPIYLSGVSTNADCTLDVSWATSISLLENCHWAGTNIVVDGAKAALAGATASLEVTSRKNLSRDAVIRLTNGGLVDIADGVNAKVAELYVGGQRIPDGSYTAASLPTAITGNGRLTVGKLGLMLLVR